MLDIRTVKHFGQLKTYVLFMSHCVPKNALTLFIVKDTITFLGIHFLYFLYIICRRRKMFTFLYNVEILDAQTVTECLVTKLIFFVQRLKI